MIIALDLGGTKMLTALIDDDLVVHNRIKVKTPQTTDGNKILRLIISSIEKLLANSSYEKTDIGGMAVCVPSPVNTSKGLVLSATNIGFKNYPLRDMLQEEIGLPVLVENDVTAGIYGEYKRGAGRGKQHIIGLYPGTGIGGGMILNGQLYRGSRGGAGEIGHMIIQVDGRLCGCGSYGCLETLSSKTALAKDLVQLAALGKSPSILQDVGSDYTEIKSRHIQKALAAGEVDVIELVERAASYLGIGMANCVNIFNPQRIILGGGLIEKLGNAFVKRAEKVMRVHALPHLLEDVDVKVAQLGDDTVITGAALLFQDELDQERKP